MNCIAKRLIIRRLNALLDDYRDDVQAARTSAATWAGRCKSLSILLDKVTAALDDSNLSEDELNSLLDDIRNLLENW